MLQFVVAPIGSARRSSIDLIGGIPTDSITEDMLTSIKLQENNYKTLYLNEPLAAGLAAESINEYIKQRKRWGKGTFEIFFSKHNPLVNKNLNLAQKICYFGSINYYFLGLARFIYLLAPSVFILLNYQSCVASIHQLLLFQFPYLVCMLGTYLYISNGKRKPFLTDAYESIIAYEFTKTLLDLLISPKTKSKFMVTTKNIKFSKTVFDYMSLMPMLPIFLILISSLLLWPVYYYMDLRNKEALFINGFWLVYNIVIMVLVLKVGFEKPQKRLFTRIPVHKSFEIKANNNSYLVHSINLSEGGTLLYAKKTNLTFLTFTKNQNVLFICHEKEGNVEINAKIIDFKQYKDKYYIRLEFVNVDKQQGETLIKNIYSFSWRWHN